MFRKLKISLISFVSQKRGAFLSLLILIVLGIILPRSASALAWLAPLIGYAIVQLFLWVVLAITSVIMALAHGLLTWSLDPAFISASFTQNEFVRLGWELTRDLANMFFVVFLVIIGLATALRISEYQVQRTLPRFIAIALLINFTPVILGVIIDASNIAMRFFLSGIGRGDFIQRTLDLQAAALGTAFQDLGKTLSEIISGGLLIRAIALIIFNLLAALIFFIFFLIFLMRYVALWILVILSPIAFLSYILPATKRMFWNPWWNQFVQWCLIGVTCAFFLYLGDQMIYVIVKSAGFLGAPPAIPLLGAVAAVLPLAVPLALLFIGFFVGLQTGAMGSSMVINWGQATARKAGAWAKKEARTKASSWARGRIEESKTAEKIRGRMEQLSKVKARPTWGAEQAGVGAWFKRQAADVVGAAAAPVTPFIRATGRTMGPGFVESGRKQIATAEAEASKDKDVSTVISKLRSSSDWATKIGYLNRLIKEDDLDEAINKGLSIPEITQAYIRAKQYDAHKDIVAAMPQIAEEEMRGAAGLPPSAVLPLSAMSSRQRSMLITAYRSDITGKIRPDRAAHISNRVYARDPSGAIDPDTGVRYFENPQVVASMVLSFDGNHISNFLRIHGRAGADAIEDTARQMAYDSNPAGYNAAPNKDIFVGDWIKDNNPRLASYMQSSAGRQFFTI